MTKNQSIKIDELEKKSTIPFYTFCGIDFTIIIVALILLLSSTASQFRYGKIIFFILAIICLATAIFFNTKTKKKILNENKNNEGNISDEDSISKKYDTFKDVQNEIKKIKTSIYTIYFLLKSSLFFSLACLFLIILCRPCKSCSTSEEGDGKIEVSILQINDVYEIAPLDNGAIGGMARIATLKKKLIDSNANTLLVIAGDFISPSIYNSVKYYDKKVFGKQMIEAMNLAHVDLAIFGNHEFDGKFEDLQNRIDESDFQWVATNTHHLLDNINIPFKKKGNNIPTTYKRSFTAKDGTKIVLGFFGITLPINTGYPIYATYDSTLSAAKATYETLAETCDAVIAITHQDMRDDEILAKAIPGLTAIIGGHEHDGRYKKIGNVYISKAKSNAKDAYHIKINYDRNRTPRIVVTVDSIKIDNKIMEDVTVKANCEKWADVATKYFVGLGFAPNNVINPSFTFNLDGLDDHVRSKPTNLTEIVASALLKAGKAKGATIAIFNAGAIRVDEIVSPPINEYSILRALPYSDSIQIVKLSGTFLRELLDSAAKIRKEGAFLHYTDNLDWKINPTPIDKLTEKTYIVAIPNFLVNGGEAKLKFIKDKVISIYQPSVKDSEMYDNRKAVIDYIKYLKK